ncbi:MAG: phytoene desaturase family protein [Gemmatimonadota bacterium]|nr:phytoene desaturase family protein [Gemmatimonadota bacterium]
MRHGSRHAVVIGAGFGGIAAALRLRARGYRVTVCEALDQAGGRARVFRRDGFTFDAGPTVITAPYLFEELFALFGQRLADHVELMPVDPFYRIQFHTGEEFNFVGDDGRLIEEIRRFNPSDVDGYRTLVAKARQIFAVGYEQLADRPFDRLSAMLRVLPSMARLESYRTVHGLVARHIKDERLRQVFSFEPLLVGGNPFRTTSIYLLIHWLERKWGVHYARGGTGALVQALVRLMESQDIELRLNAPVDRIAIERGKVRGVVIGEGATARSIGADLVVANADPTMVYRTMIPPRERPLATRRPVRQSMGLFVGYFGTATQHPGIAHHTILLGPRYRGLLDDIFRRRVLADDFSLYVHAPTRSDPTMAPAGHDAFYVLSPVPNLRSGTRWAEVRDEYFDRLLESIETRLLPGLRSSLVTSLTMTPAEFESTLRSTDGAAFGPEPSLAQSAYFRYHNRSSIDGLYFVGAGTHPGAGVPGVLSSAKLLERIVPAA